MAAIERCFVLLNGVVVQPLWQVTIDVLKQQGNACNEGLRYALRRDERQCHDGVLTLQQYCRLASQQGEEKTQKSALADRILARLAPLPGMPVLLSTMSRSLQLHLVSCLSQAETSMICDSLGLQDVFLPQRFVITAACGGSTGKGLLPALLESGLLSAGSSLWVDDQPGRTSQAIRAGVDAIIFVDAMRLQRELSLRQLIGREGK